MDFHEDGYASAEGAPSEMSEDGFPLQGFGGGTSWRETLARFPDLPRRYPLATCSEGEGEEADEMSGKRPGNNHTQESEDTPPTPAGSAAGSVTVRHAPLSPHGAAVAAAGGENEALPPPTPASARSSSSGQGTARLRSTYGWQPAPASATTAAGVGPGGPPASGADGGFLLNGHGTLLPPPGVSDRCGSAAELSAAWAEVERIRRSLIRRERDLAQREAAVRRSEARNFAAARQLNDLRSRLDEYGEELEEGVLSLTAQQNALRDERRKAMELQARVRRLCAATVREDVMASRASEWERRSWTPTQTM